MVSASIVIAGAYIAYAVAAIGLFAWRPPLQAALVALFAGWVLLPVADYPPQVVVGRSFSFDVIGTALPSNMLVNKALVVPVVVLLCLVARSPRLFRAVRPTWADAAMAAFCLWPIAGGLAGTAAWPQALVQAGYLAGVWGGSWAIGRVLLAGEEGRRSLVGACVVGGLALVPVAVIEGLRGPVLYALAYGPHPFQFDGFQRYVGMRPLALFEHGNQYGIWMAVAALAAFSIAWKHRPRQPMDLAIAAVLIVFAAASQSVGAILLLALGIVWLVASNAARRIGIAAAGLALALGGTAYLSGKVPLDRWVRHTATGQTVLGALHATGRGSLSWRVRRDQLALPVIYRAPVTGYGRWDWWRPLESHPWGLPLLIAGQFGLLSLAVLALALLAGAVRDMWRGSRSVLPAVVVVAGIDACLNSYVFLPAILAAGALAAPLRPSSQRSEQAHD